jgi:hypothetical protein
LNPKKRVVVVYICLYLHLASNLDTDEDMRRARKKITKLMVNLNVNIPSIRKHSSEMKIKRK